MQATLPTPQVRVQSIDALRGLVMIIMALDHVRDYFHAGAMAFSPEDLTRTTTTIFLTRWITHICAPVFMFTAGLGAYFWLRRGRTKGELSRFLVTRGLWLIVLELIVVRWVMFFSLTSGVVLVTVLWALGWSMIVLAALVHLPARVLAVVSVAVIVLHNLLDPVTAQQFGSAAWVWNVLHQLGVFTVAGVPVLLAYPLVPWFAVMAAGFCFGELMTLDAPQRQRWMTCIGLTLIAAFLVIRSINVYGDPVPWSSDVPGKTILSFLRCNKYPPSLDFLLMTLGPGILILGWLDRLRFEKTNPLIVFGRVPLFYFIAHMLLAHLLTFPLAYLRYGDPSFLRLPPPSIGGDAKLFPPDYGWDLWVVYAMWIVVVVALYPVCRWFAGVKERRRSWWLSYL